MCAAGYIGCITPTNGCNKSQTECNCPTGYTKFGFMNCCARDDRIICIINSKKKKYSIKVLSRWTLLKKKMLGFLIK